MTHKYHLRRYNADSQAQTSGPEGICIFTEQLWSFWCRKVLRNSWESWGKLEGPGSLTFSSPASKAHNQRHNCCHKRSAGQCQPNCSFRTLEPRPRALSALWVPKASCSSGGSRGAGVLGGCLAGWEERRNMQIIHWRAGSIWVKTVSSCSLVWGMWRVGSNSLKLSHREGSNKGRFWKLQIFTLFESWLNHWSVLWSQNLISLLTYRKK